MFRIQTLSSVWFFFYQDTSHHGRFPFGFLENKFLFNKNQACAERTLCHAWQKICSLKAKKRSVSELYNQPLEKLRFLDNACLFFSNAHMLGLRIFSCFDKNTFLKCAKLLNFFWFKKILKDLHHKFPN